MLRHLDVPSPANWLAVGVILVVHSIAVSVGRSVNSRHPRRSSSNARTAPRISCRSSTCGGEGLMTLLLTEATAFVMILSRM
mmetsp:Transcript_25423/g.60106  ORF Transcript_25423/g.60106 Transcript_25423/m.60106 type:complete len:82 (-) Transcript_25423:385-630(-)